MYIRIRIDDMLLNALKDIRNGLGSSLAISKLIKETKRILPEHLGDDGLAIIPTEVHCVAVINNILYIQYCAFNIFFIVINNILYIQYIYIYIYRY